MFLSKRHVLSEPDLPSNLLAVICRFRERKYPINADIESMYMKVSVRPADRKILRFIWGTLSQIFTSILVSFLAQNARQLVRTSLSKDVVTTTKTITTTSKNLSTATSTSTIFTSQPTPWKKHLQLSTDSLYWRRSPYFFFTLNPSFDSSQNWQCHFRET